MTSNEQQPSDQQQVQEIFERIAGDLAMIADRPLNVQSVDVARSEARVAGSRTVHISFKLGIQFRERIHHGCLLVPLADSIALAAYLLMMPDDAVKSKRSLNTLDGGIKDAMLEIGNFIGGATDAALRGLGLTDVRVRSESCQGVKANVRPALIYTEGTPLIVGRAKVQLHTWPAYEMILLLPVLFAPEPALSSAASAKPA